MNRMPSRARVAPRDDETANGRFKRSFGARLWSGMIAATVLHFGVFALWPSMTAQDLVATAESTELIDLPPEVDIPEPPEQIAKPAKPVIGDTELDEDVTIASTRPEDYRPEELAPPEVDTAADAGGMPMLTPYTVAPRLLNPAEVQRALQAEYPPALRDAGIGGVVTVLVRIDESGAVLDGRVHESSGYEALDAAALAVVREMRFTAALNMDTPVPVWVRQDVTFVARQPPAV